MSRPSPPTAVVFDMDGVIFDTEPIWLEAETALFARRGVVFPPELAKRIMGVPGPQAMQIVAREFGIADDAVALSNELNALFHDIVMDRLPVMEGLLERLEHLESIRVPKAVATSTERDLASRMLTRAGLLGRFEFVLTRDDVTYGKPHPEIYLRACAELRCDPSSTVVIEDSLAGSKAARAAGCTVIVLRHPLTATVAFHDADIVIDSHADNRVEALFAGDASDATT